MFKTILKPYPTLFSLQGWDRGRSWKYALLWIKFKTYKKLSYFWNLCDFLDLTEFSFKLFLLKTFFLLLISKFPKVIQY